MAVDGNQSKADATLGQKKDTTPNGSYTQEQVDKMILDAKTSVLADAGRYKTEAEKAMKAAEAASKRLEDISKRQREAELEQYKDQPAEIARIRAEDARQQAEAKLADYESQLNEAKQRAQTLETEKNNLSKGETARQIAAKHNVSADLLAKMAKFTDGSEQAIEEIAKDLPKTQTTKMRPDSNRAIGGMLTLQQAQQEFFKDPTPERYARIQEVRNSVK